MPHAETHPNASLRMDPDQLKDATGHPLDATIRAVLDRHWQNPNRRHTHVAIPVLTSANLRNELLKATKPLKPRRRLWLATELKLNTDAQLVARTLEVQKAYKPGENILQVLT